MDDAYIAFAISNSAAFRFSLAFAKIYIYIQIFLNIDGKYNNKIWNLYIISDIY